MRRGTFFAFVAPSLLMMIVFIAVPLALVVVQSFQNTQHVFRTESTENCTPGFPNPVCTTQRHIVPVMNAAGLPETRTDNVGWDNFRSLLRPDAVAAALAPGGGGLSAILSLDFYKALRFTLTFTLISLPLVVLLGLGLALALNATMRLIRGPVIFVSLLPFIVTPVIGSLSIRWLFASDGILARLIASLAGHPVALLAHGWTLEALMIFYRVWNVGPFAFIIFYAGLQTINVDALHAAVVDGASRWQRLRYVVLPHLAPLIVFVTLIHLMDAYRVFDEIVGFASQSQVISLQWLTFDLLTPNFSGNRAIGRASASAMLTMVGIVVILAPLIRQTWREHRHG